MGNKIVYLHAKVQKKILWTEYPFCKFVKFVLLLSNKVMTLEDWGGREGGVDHVADHVAHVKPSWNRKESKARQFFDLSFSVCFEALCGLIIHYFAGTTTLFVQFACKYLKRIGVSCGFFWIQTRGIVQKVLSEWLHS